MFDKMVRRVVQTGKAHGWFKPFALLALLGLFGGATLARWTAKQSAGIRQAVGERRAAFARSLSARRERRTEGPRRPSHRPAARAAAAALAACMAFTLMPVTAFAEGGEAITVSSPEELKTAIQNSTGTSDNPTVITIASEGIAVTGNTAISIDGKHVKLTGGTLTRDPSFQSWFLFQVRNGGNLTLENITLDGNKGTVTAGRGLILVESSLTIGTGAVLKNNASTDSTGGGAVVLSDNGGTVNFTMTGGVITGNTAKTGGAIYDEGSGNTTIHITGGEISGNTATGNDGTSNQGSGGGIYSKNNLIIEGGTITGNTATSGQGGGIYKGDNSNKTFTISGGSITNNKGGGVYAAAGRAKVTLSGEVTITGNTLSDGTTPRNLYLKGANGKLSIDTALTDGSSVGVSMATPGVFAEGEGAAASAGCFTSDDTAYTVAVEGQSLKLSGGSAPGGGDDAAAYIGNTPYDTLADAFAAASSVDSQNPTVIELAKDLTFGSEGDITAGITVPAGKSVKLTSKGGNAFTISRKAANETKDYFFKVYDGCTLILENVVLDGKNLATGGEHYFATVAGADLVLEDGAVLKNNTSPTIRAGTANYTNTISAITMNGGEISGNSAGGIQMLPNFSSQNGKTLRFTMNGGTIKNNAKSSSGAGIYGSNSYSSSGCTAEVIIHGGKIINNTSTVSSTDTVTGGGGVYCDSVFRMDGGTISGNTANRMGGGVYLSSGVSEAAITGGTISNNTASGLEDTKKGKGDNLYINKTQNLVLNPAENIDGIFLYEGASMKIPSALTHTITLEGAYNRNAQMIGLLVASGASDYTITADDLAKFSYKDNAYGFALNSNQIKLANPSYPVTFHLTGMQGHTNSTPLPASIEKGKDLTVQLVASSGYKLPAASVTVKVGNVELNEYQLQNYESVCSIGIKKDKITGPVEITAEASKKGDDAQLSALTYWYASTPGDVAVPGFSSEAQNPTYNVVLPASVAKGATIYVDKTKSDSNATNSTDPSPITLADGKGTWSVTITSEDGTKTNTYTVNFTIAQPTVTSVTVTPSATSVQKGTTRQFSAIVAGENDPAQTVTWSVEGSTASGTGISDTGLLTVDANEAAATLTIRATSTVDNTKSGTATVNVTAQPVYNISGTVQESGGQLITGASVTLRQGASDVAQTTTDQSGSYSFVGVPAGLYNVVAESGGKTMTILVELTNANATEKNIQLPAENRNSVVKVEDGAPDIVAGGVDAVAAAVEVVGGNQVTVTLVIKPETDQGDKDKINGEAAGRTVDCCLDLTLQKSIDGGTADDIHDTGDKVLEVVVPYDFTGKTNVAVYRVHDGQAKPLTERTGGRPSAPYQDGTFWLDQANGRIHIYASKFSTYAIAYKPRTETPGGSHSSSGSSGSSCFHYGITASAGEGGTISPSGEVYVRELDDQIFTVTAAEGYQIDRLLVDGREAALTNGTYTFREVLEQHTIQVLFRKVEVEPEKTNNPATGDNCDPAVRFLLLSALAGLALAAARRLGRTGEAQREN